LSKFNKNWKQFESRGFSECDLFSLDAHIGSLLAPRLKVFKEVATKFGVPQVFIVQQKDFNKVEKLKSQYFNSLKNEKMKNKEKILLKNKYSELESKLLKSANEQYQSEIDKMILSFEKVSSKDYYDNKDQNEIKIKEGLESFAKYFTCLWW